MHLDRHPYSPDLSNAEWQLLEPLLPAEKRGGRYRKYPMREVINAIQYVLRSGRAWRLMPTTCLSGGPLSGPSPGSGGIGG